MSVVSCASASSLLPLSEHAANASTLTAISEGAEGGSTFSLLVGVGKRKRRAEKVSLRGAQGVSRIFRSVPTPGTFRELLECAS